MMDGKQVVAARALLEKIQEKKMAVEAITVMTPMTSLTGAKSVTVSTMMTSSGFLDIIARVVAVYETWAKINIETLITTEENMTAAMIGHDHLKEAPRQDTTTMKEKTARRGILTGINPTVTHMTGIRQKTRRDTESMTRNSEKKKGRYMRTAKKERRAGNMTTDIENGVTTGKERGPEETMIDTAKEIEKRGEMTEKMRLIARGATIGGRTMNTTATGMMTGKGTAKNEIGIRIETGTEREKMRGGIETVIGKKTAIEIGETTDGMTGGIKIVIIRRTQEPRTGIIETEARIEEMMPETAIAIEVVGIGVMCPLIVICLLVAGMTAREHEREIETGIGRRCEDILEGHIDSNA